MEVGGHTQSRQKILNKNSEDKFQVMYQKVDSYACQGPGQNLLMAWDNL